MTPAQQQRLRSAVRTIADFPKPGIQFRDITTLLGDAEAFKLAVEAIAARWQPETPTHVAGIEARGFILGGAVAHRLNAAFIPIRKKGKLPHATVSIAYTLEYGEDHLEMHRDAAGSGDRILLIDDLIATGGTAMAALELLRRQRASVVGASFVIDLPDLQGSRSLQAQGLAVHSLLDYPGH
jgi:adenine phosphoribosyltransferase